MKPLKKKLQNVIKLPEDKKEKAKQENVWEDAMWISQYTMIQDFALIAILVKKQLIKC